MASSRPGGAARFTSFCLSPESFYISQQSRNTRQIVGGTPTGTAAGIYRIDRHSNRCGAAGTPNASKSLSDNF